MNTPEKPVKPTRIKVVRQADELTVVIPKRDSFHKASQNVSNKLGSPIAFALASLLIVVWILTGPVFGFSDTWQLVINTTTTIVTFLMVFAIQNTQNRDAKAMQLKLNELINATRNARPEFVDVEDLSDVELNALQIEFKEIRDKMISKQSGEVK